jgi:hypothetical protein
LQVQHGKPNAFMAAFRAVLPAETGTPNKSRQSNRPKASVVKVEFS